MQAEKWVMANIWEPVKEHGNAIRHKSGLTGTNKGKAATYRGKNYDLFLNGPIYWNKDNKMKYFSVQRRKRRKNEPYNI